MKNYKKINKIFRVLRETSESNRVWPVLSTWFVILDRGISLCRVGTQRRNNNKTTT
jgi:hypothetical protein